MRRYVTTTEGITTPWDLLSERLSDVNTELVALGVVYIVGGRVR